MNGSCVFDCMPCEGAIETGKSHEIMVTFNPDHESRHFSDGARVVLFSSVSKVCLVVVNALIEIKFNNLCHQILKSSLTISMSLP